MAQIVGVNGTTIQDVDLVTLAAHYTEYTNWAGVIRKANPAGLATYSAASGLVTVVATPDPVFSITGSASKLVRVLRFGLSCVQTTAGVNNWFIKKHSSAFTGGTPTTCDAIPHDSADGGAAALVQSWTADPTGGGTVVGLLWAGRINSPVVNTAGMGGNLVTQVDFTKEFGKPIVLRSDAEVVSWNFNGVALPAGLVISAFCTWTEEAL